MLLAFSESSVWPDDPDLSRKHKIRMLKIGMDFHLAKLCTYVFIWVDLFASTPFYTMHRFVTYWKLSRQRTRMSETILNHFEFAYQTWYIVWENFWPSKHFRVTKLCIWMNWTLTPVLRSAHKFVVHTHWERSRQWIRNSELFSIISSSYAT